MGCSIARRLRWTAGSFLFFLACATPHEGISIASAQDISDIDSSKNNYERKERAKVRVSGDGLHKQHARAQALIGGGGSGGGGRLGGGRLGGGGLGGGGDVGGGELISLSYPTQGISGPVTMGKNSVFVVYNGDLYELRKKNVISGTPPWTWIKHNHPVPHRKLTPVFAPGGVMRSDNPYGKGVFVVDEKGKLWKRSLSGTPTWIAHGSMKGTIIRSGISAIHKEKNLWFVSNGRLYHHDVDTKAWMLIPDQSGLSTKSTPLALGDFVYCVGDNGNLYEYDPISSRYGGPAPFAAWADHGKHASSADANIVLCGAAMGSEFFCTTEGGHFVERRQSRIVDSIGMGKSSTGDWIWVNHKDPAGYPNADTGTPTTVTPTTVLFGKLHVTVRPNPNSARLVELSGSTWTDHGNPGASGDFSDPAGMSSGVSFVSKFDSEELWEYRGGWIKHGKPQ